MFTSVIEWHNTAEELPAKSGRYLVNYGLYRASIMTVDYSSVHKCFNALDYEAEPKTAIDVLWWAELPVFPANETN